MNSRSLLLLTSLLVAAFQGFSQSTNKPLYSAIYAFGDCLTDTHNAEPVPFYSWAGRTANGPMWIEQASTNLDLAYSAAFNFAVSANATFDMTNQVTEFVNRYGSHATTSNALFAIWGGPVDFYWHLGQEIFGVPFDSPTNDAVWNSVIVQGVNNLSNIVMRLYGRGGRSFLVPNVDDVSRQPVVITWLSQKIRSGVQQRVREFNAALAQALARLDQAYPDLRIVSPDAYGLFTDFIDNPPKYGMTISYPAAMQDPNLSNQSFTGPGADYVFWDQYGHPTTKGHGIIAASFMNALTNARPEKVSVVMSNSATLSLSKLLIGRAYNLQASTNLTSWQDVHAFTAITGTNQWADPAPGGSTRFYRLTWQP